MLLLNKEAAEGDNSPPAVFIIGSAGSADSGCGSGSADSGCDSGSDSADCSDSGCDSDCSDSD